MKPYQEIQKFDQWWLKLIIILVIFATLTPLYMIFNQAAFEEDMLLPIVVATFITAIAIVLLYLFRLETTIDAKGIHYRFFPFKKNTIPWQEIEECYVRQYSPLKEYGGWGIRFGFSGKAYNVKGNKGIQLKLKSGKKILFGTQNESEVQNVINFYRQNIQ